MSRVMNGQMEAFAPRQSQRMARWESSPFVGIELLICATVSLVTLRDDACCPMTRGM